MIRNFFYIFAIICCSFWAISCTNNSDKVAPTDNPELSKIDSALVVADNTGKIVLCQLGGDWCKWCRRLSEEMAQDTAIQQFMAENYIFLHVNFVSRDDEPSLEVSKRLGDAARFGFPVWIFLRPDGSILHIQDTSYLEEGEGYNHEYIMRCLRNWSPSVVNKVQ